MLLFAVEFVAQGKHRDGYLGMSLPQVICGLGGTGSQGDAAPSGQYSIRFAVSSESVNSFKSHSEDSCHLYQAHKAL